MLRLYHNNIHIYGYAHYLLPVMIRIFTSANTMFSGFYAMIKMVRRDLPSFTRLALSLATKINDVTCANSPYSLSAPFRKEFSLSFLKNLRSLFHPRDRKEPYFYWAYVQCGHCQEKLRIHVDLRNDLSIRYGETDKEDIYFTRKRIVGSKGCFKPIEIELTFDRQQRLLDQQIQGGVFISQEEFTAEQADV